MFDVVSKISPNPLIQVIDNPGISINLALVDEIWNSALIARPWLVDEDIFNVCDIENGTLYGFFVPYRFYVAQQEDVTRSLGFHIKPLAVTSFTKTIDGLTLLAKRGIDVYQDAGLWELAPCGGVTSRSVDKAGNVNYIDTLEEEFKEELGIPAKSINSKHCTSLILDKGSNVYELIVKVLLSLTQAEVMSCFSCRESSEYTEVMFLNDVTDFSNLALGTLSHYVLLQKL